MSTYYPPGSPYRQGSPAPQRVSAAGGSATTAAVPQVDYHHPYPTYQPDQHAWSQPMAQASSSAMPGFVRSDESPSYPPTRYQPAVWAPDFSQSYQPPTWTTADAGRSGTRNALAAVIVGLALLLVAGAVTVIVVLGRTSSASPAAPPHSLAPALATSAGSTSSAPSAPRPFPAQPGVDTGDRTSAAPSPTTAGPTRDPAQPTTAPAEPTTPPAGSTTMPAEPTTDPNGAAEPGRQEAERTAEGFVDALRSSDFERASSFICSAQAATFAAGAPALAEQVYLSTLEVSDVRVTGPSRATMTMSYQPVAGPDTLSESLSMTVEDDTWKICS